MIVIGYNELRDTLRDIVPQSVPQRFLRASFNKRNVGEMMLSIKVQPQMMLDFDAKVSSHS